MANELHPLRISVNPPTYSAEQYSALTGGAGLVERSRRGRLRVSGADRRSYLQGLLTNDIAALGPGTGCYAAYLTAQGRMIADMRLFETGEHLLVDLDGTLAGAIAERWTQFVFSEDVEVADITAATAEIGVYGPRAARVAAAVCGLPEPELAALVPYGNRPAEAGLVARSDEFGVLGFDVIVPAALKDEAVRRALEAGAVPIEPALAEAMRIEAGRPLFLVDMGEDTIPLEAGIEDRAISLTKGCYVGQEIIIRVLHRGHGRVARRLVKLSLAEGAGVPARGDRIAGGGKEMGAITSAAISPSTGRPVALGYVHRDFATPGASVEVSGAPATVVGAA
jgi:folate-binding protein YgfZ